MDENREQEDILTLTAEELDDLALEEEISCGEFDENVPEYYFANPGPYVKFEQSPGDSKREISFDDDGNIVVKNLSAFWLPDVRIVDRIGGTEYTVTGSYVGSETLNKKLRRIMEQNAPGDEFVITEDDDE